MNVKERDAEYLSVLSDEWQTAGQVAARLGGRCGSGLGKKLYAMSLNGLIEMRSQKHRLGYYEGLYRRRQPDCSS